MSIEKPAPALLPPPPIIEKKREVPKQESKPQLKKGKLRFIIQLGVFENLKFAESQIKKLRLYGYHPKIKKGNGYYIVYLGYFKDYYTASTFFKKKIKPLGYKGIVKFTRVEDNG